MQLPNQQTPQEEIAERVAEGAPGIGVAAHLLAVDNLRRNWHSWRRQVDADRQHQSSVLGNESPPPNRGEEMGDLTVKGDTYIYGSDAAEILKAMGDGASQETPTPITPSSTPPPSLPPENALKKRLIGAALLAAGVLGGSGIGVGLPWLLGAFEKGDRTTIVQPGDERSFTVDVVPGGAEQ